MSMERAGLITPAEAARILGCGTRTVYRNLVPAMFTPGGRRRYSRADVEALAEQLRQGPPVVQLAGQTTIEDHL